MTMIQIQKWHDSIRHLIMMSSGRATVQLEMYNRPMGEFDVTAEIYALWVNKEIRKQKFATALLDKAEDIARKNGHKTVYLFWDKRITPHWVLDWYYRRGYEEIFFNEYRVGLIKKLI